MQGEALFNLTPEQQIFLRNSLERRIGTVENWIVLKPKQDKREKLYKWLPEKYHKSDFSKFKQTGDVKSHHVVNLISTPELSVASLKLGLFLFEHFLSKNSQYIDHNYSDTKYFWQKVFSLQQDDIKTSVFGEERVVYFENKKSARHEFHQMPFRSLPSLLKRHNIYLDNCDLRIALQNLHNFGFLTITDINNKNCIKKDLIDIETGCVHIDLNVGVVTAKLNLQWRLNR